MQQRAARADVAVEARPYQRRVSPPWRNERSPRSRSTVADRVTNPMAGIGLVTLAMAIFPLMDAISKLLQARLPVAEVIWGRQLVYVVVILPIALWRHGGALFRPAMPWLQVLRGTTMMLSTLLFTAAIARMPLADALGVFFFHPFLAVALSPLVLGEQVGPWRWGAVVTGFFGALIVVRPGFAEITPAIMLAAASGICFATTALLTRKVAGRDPALVTLGIASLMALGLTGGMLPFVWLPPTPWECALMGVAGLIGVSGFWMMIKAYDLATASQIAPFCYVEIVGAVIAGYLMFGDFPAPIVWLGLAVIVVSGIVIAWRESVQQQRLRAEAP